jgi:MFS family permease
VRSIVTPYVGVLREPGALRFSLSALIARLPLSMIGLGIVLLVSAQRGNYATAGILTGFYVVASAIATPIAARFVDRWGQRSVVSVIIAIHVPSLIGFVIAVTNSWPIAALIALAFLAGATQPASGSLVRARWIHAIDTPTRLRAAFAWESILDEVIFVTGPPLATILAIMVAPAAPLVAAALLVLTGTLLLISHRPSEPPIHAPVSALKPAWRNLGLIWLTLIMIALGAVFGSLEIATVAATAALGVPAAAGLVLALYAAGSLVGGVLFGAWNPRSTHQVRQLLIGAGVLALVTLPFPLVTGVWALSLVAVLAGLAVAPVLIMTNFLVSTVVPEGQLTEGLAWVNTTGLGAGVALSAAATGALIDLAGPRAGYALTAGAGIATVLLAITAAGFIRTGITRSASGHQP